MRGIERAALKAARLRRGLSQSRLSIIMGHEPNAAHRWETGEREPDTLADFKMLCDVLGVSADVLLGREKFPSARFLADVIREAEPTLEGDLPERIAGAIHQKLREMIGEAS